MSASQPHKYFSNADLSGAALGIIAIISSMTITIISMISMIIIISSS